MSEGFTIKSTAFVNNGLIPEKYSCDGISPQLIISNVPKGTKSLILLLEDPDARPVVGKTFMHLIAQLIAQIEAGIIDIPEGIKGFKKVELINNDAGRADYYGPCPPKGKKHDYFFTVIALNQKINIKDHSADYFRNTWNRTSRFYSEMKDSITGIAQLMGKFGKK